MGISAGFEYTDDRDDSYEDDWECDSVDLEDDDVDWGWQWDDDDDYIDEDEE